MPQIRRRIQIVHVQLQAGVVHVHDQRGVGLRFGLGRDSRLRLDERLRLRRCRLHPDDRRDVRAALRGAGAFSGWNPVAITVTFTASASDSLRITPKLICTSSQSAIEAEVASQ